jgi:uncharacterized protein (TIGR03435 family)
MRTLLTAAATAAALLPCLATAQESRPVTFEAASVKKFVTGAAGFVGRQPGGRLTASGATMREIIEFAYLIQPYQLVNAPNWINEERWDIIARLAVPPGPVPAGQPDDTLLALRALLADRFQLTVRRETRSLPMYALVLARPDGRLGTQLTKSPIDCEALRAARGKGDTSPLPAAAKQCGTQGRIGSLAMGGSPMTMFADALSRRLGRPVSDRTGLAGTWDLTLTHGVETTPPPDANGPSIFTALQEQLGLKLDSTTGPVEVLVVDRIERARED